MTPIAIALLFVISSTVALPASNEQLDKATINDVLVNAVSEEKKHDQTPLQVQSVGVGAQPPASTIQITGLSTGASSPQPSAPEENSSIKPPRVGTMFARFIDDIFQIPITVLQSVARLITNPFQRKSPEIVATVS
ncbi:unnamed protein product [Psylliodes chrysocephalus]|nr:unnamed protein product [Psylliodes chrysocephala]